MMSVSRIYFLIFSRENIRKVGNKAIGNTTVPCNTVVVVVVVVHYYS
jgi:hypothetical protein